jgi:hypothetical protein
MRHRHTAPQVTAVVLNRVYNQPLSVADAVLHVAAGAGVLAAPQTPPPPPAAGPADGQAAGGENAPGSGAPEGPAATSDGQQQQQQQQQQQPPQITLVLPGDPRAYRLQLLRRTVVAIPPDAPKLVGQQLRLSQRSTQEQVRRLGEWRLSNVCVCEREKDFPMCWSSWWLAAAG